MHAHIFYSFKIKKQGQKRIKKNRRGDRPIWKKKYIHTGT